VEIRSPGDTWPEIENKVRDYLNRGVRLVWVIDPKPATVTIYRPSAPRAVLHADDVLDGGDVVPGFACPVRRIFD
jgi:Uma2 family endonuclease